jgi:uncharacterized BrkB/YihY/UPF0761 family membrane protein
LTLQPSRSSRCHSRWRQQQLLLLLLLVVVVVVLLLLLLLLLVVPTASKGHVTVWLVLCYPAAAPTLFTWCTSLSFHGGDGPPLAPPSLV